MFRKILLVVIMTAAGSLPLDSSAWARGGWGGGGGCTHMVMTAYGPQWVNVCGYGGWDGYGGGWGW